MESRIIIGKCVHNGKELECYIPQINNGNEWIDVLGKSEYILKDSINPLVICKKCMGNGCLVYLQINGALPNYMELIYDESRDCTECGKGKGLRRGDIVDNKPMAQRILDRALKEIEESEKLVNKFKITKFVADFKQNPTTT